ncbi:mitochondrial atp epsilon chain [Ceraceosorus bombacis]|uniref:Mitochondrial atp epsilon chain n=1 Tax=Ceraceosorus bombacis TaxID=401625 RepID=A0A0P1BC89_9BASI|nr:mitochondrial atp epsilon chain [Ceraceosorus bombacis]
MSSAAPWRAFFGYNKYTQIAGQATRAALKEAERVEADRRGVLSLRYQEWKDGQSGEHIVMAKQQQNKSA